MQGSCVVNRIFVNAYLSPYSLAEVGGTVDHTRLCVWGTCLRVSSQ